VATPGITLPLFAGAAVILSIERLTYAWIWHHPGTFQVWCANTAVGPKAEPPDIVRALFFVFKAVQASVFFLWFYVHSGGALAPASFEVFPLVTGSTFIVTGQLLVVSAMTRLGRSGVFYGNRFGHEVRWCDEFPYSVMSHPQYVGAVLTIWGLFIAMRFPAPDWYYLPALETAYYIAGGFAER